jgi:hypothetical protein
MHQQDIDDFSVRGSPGDVVKCHFKIPEERKMPAMVIFEKPFH